MKPEKPAFSDEAMKIAMDVKARVHKRYEELQATDNSMKGLCLRLESKLEALDKHQLRTGRAQGLEISIAALKEVIDAIEEMNNRFENAIAMIDVALGDR